MLENRDDGGIGMVWVDEGPKPVSMEQLDMAMRMLGYEPSSTAPTTDSPTASKQPQRVEGGNPYGNRAQRRANASKRGGASRNGRAIQRHSRQDRGSR
jgi:hypothetical protein